MPLRKTITKSRKSQGYKSPAQASWTSPASLPAKDPFRGIYNTCLRGRLDGPMRDLNQKKVFSSRMPAPGDERRYVLRSDELNNIRKSENDSCIMLII